MKICIANHDFSLGGVERVAVEIAEGLQCIKDYEVTLLNFFGNHKFFYDVKSEVDVIDNEKRRLFIERVQLRCMTDYYKFTNKGTLQLSRYFKRQLSGLISMIEENHFDCMILCQGILTALVPSLKQRFPKLKIIAWQHNPYDVYTKKVYASYLDEYVDGLQKADHVVCLTKYDKKFFAQHNKNTAYIYNPVTIKNNRISDLQGNNIIFTGRLVMEQKGLDYLVDIVEKSPNNWKWFLAGEGQDENKVRAMISEKNIDSKINLLGALRGQDLVNHYVRGSIFISTSRFEGFGLVLLEAMSCGLPIVSFDIPGPREVLADGECGILVETYNTKQFYREVEKLMNDEALRKRYQQKSLERIKDFSRDNIIKEWRSLIG